MLCGEKTRLLDAYTAAVESQAEMVSKLSKITENSTAFKEALTNAELARRNAERARLALDHHKGTHGC
ncbi:MAG: hypothetical protein DMG57_25485 [Acidobacteria bacterium]|nr:MAG: hypothetical protein DMG57_25485 [Acidobacteriota bacterium]